MDEYPLPLPLTTSTDPQPIATTAVTAPQIQSEPESPKDDVVAEDDSAKIYNSAMSASGTRSTGTPPRSPGAEPGSAAPYKLQPSPSASTPQISNNRGPSANAAVSNVNSSGHRPAEDSPSRSYANRTGSQFSRAATPGQGNTQAVHTASSHRHQSNLRHNSHSSTPVRPVPRQDGKEELMNITISRNRPDEKFFVECPELPTNRAADGTAQSHRHLDYAGQPRNEEELLLQQFAEYTDDDSFFSSGSAVIESNPRRMADNPMRGRAVQSVHETLQFRTLTNGRVPEDTEWQEAVQSSWLHQIHHRALALNSTSLFILPARWTPRVVVYNVMHHWLFEMLLFFEILGYSIFQATWGRYTTPQGKMTKPDQMVFADVFYTILLGLEIISRIFATGLVLHSRAFLRSPWHWLDTAVLVLMIMSCTGWQQLWVFTAWRLIRCIKCLTFVPMPIRMKLLAKSLLRSTNKLMQVTIMVIYFMFFFALLGLQLFVGELHSRCVHDLTGEVSDQICRPVSTGRYWFYWGHHCAQGFTCVQDRFPNPHYDFRSFDDIGHALLSTFQIMTFQGWTSLMMETNDGLCVMAFLYYAFTILICTWIVPSLYLGVFLEKIERTTHLFILKQLSLFDAMLLEQRQRLSASIRLHDFVDRDENGFIEHYPEYDKKISSGTDTSSNSLKPSNPHAKKNVKRTQWTDEQRVQLALSLTRQRNVAEKAERKRTGPALKNKSHTATAPSGSNGPSQPQSDSKPSAMELRPTGVDNFALGGRVGRVQHHPTQYAIGSSDQTDLPFAVRQDAAAEAFRFLDPNAGSAADGGNSIARDWSTPEGNHNVSQGNISRPPLGMTSVSMIRETAGVVPNRHPHSATMRANPAAVQHTTSTSQKNGTVNEDSQHPPPAKGEATYMVNDPEGGAFEHAESYWDSLTIIRNILHMFTEGYPRILTQYLWEHRMMQYRYGLRPLTYTNRYEEAALQKLRARRRLERAEERDERRRHGLPVSSADASELDENPDSTHEASWMQDEGLVAGSMSPIRMARNIKENAPITAFNYLMYFFLFANAVFNASRYSGMPSYWEDGTFFAGVCFSSIFTLELLLRLLALGPGPFFLDMFHLIESSFVILSLFQLGFSRTNTLSLFNWVRWLKLFRVIPLYPLRRVTGVLLHAAPHMLYALVFFSLYMFMWLLLGMSFFGSRMGWIDYDQSDYTTRGSFETFSYAVYAVAQAFSVNRDQWLYLSWSGMRVRGGYTIMYFIATVVTAAVFHYFFIAVMTWAWQSQVEREDFDTPRQPHKGFRHPRLPWFDFTVWRSFKHIHGGFERRDVAPDEVYFINEDMRRQLRLVEAKGRTYKRMAGESYANGEYMGGTIHQKQPQQKLKYINMGGQLHRQPSISRDLSHGEKDFVYGNDAQLRFARSLHSVPATTYYMPEEEENTTDNSAGGGDVQFPPPGGQPPRAAQSPSMHSDVRSIINPLVATRPSHSRSMISKRTSNRQVNQADQPDTDAHSVVTAQLLKLGRLGPDGQQPVTEERRPENFQHLLLPGPRLRYKSMVDGSRRVFECCLDCNTHKQMPLQAPYMVEQRTADELHHEHCHMAAVRSSRQLVLSTLIGYARMQQEYEVRPTKRLVETVLGQAWSCGLLLYDTIENLSCSELPEDRRDWSRMLQALEVQQWLLGLHVGEEQVGRATLAYILAHQQRQERVTLETHYAESWQDHALLAISPSNPFRRAVTAVVESLWFETFILVVIFSASACLAAFMPGDDDRDLGGSYNSGKYKALHVLDDTFTIIFTMEMILKWVSMGIVLPVGQAYFWHLWNVFDCFIVVISLVSWGDDGIFLRYLKVMRCFRILGPLRHWSWNASMMHVARTLWDSIPTLANVCLLMLLNYIVWAIIFVSMFMDKMSSCVGNATAVEKQDCLDQGHAWVPVRRNFQNFYESLLTTFEVSTGAEWLDVIYSAVDSHSTTLAPIANRHPYLGLVFVAYYYVSHFIFFSLFIAAVIYCYMVTKNSSFVEGETGGNFEHQLWVRMQEMVLRLKPSVRLLPMNNDTSRLLHKVVRHRYFESFMAFVLTLNMITMSLAWYHMSTTQEKVLNILQYIFVAIFTVEVLLRLAAHGPRFFTRWAYGWDLLVCGLSFIQIGLAQTHNHRVPFNVNVLRMLRAGRFLSVIDVALPFRTYLALFSEVLQMSVPGLVNVTLVYMLAVYVFAILGLHFLGYVVTPAPDSYLSSPYNNFMTFVNSLIMVFRLSTLENWVAMLRGSMDRGNYCDKANARCGPTNFSPVYYIPLVVCFFLLLSTLYMAVIVDHYVSAVRMRSTVARLHDLYRFQALWSARDPNATLFLPTTDLVKILEALHLPLGLSSRHNRVELLKLLREYDITDHDGWVYYYEVLLPLARRVMAMAFHEGHNGSSSATSYDVTWRRSESALAPAAMQFQSLWASAGGRHTVAEFYATSYVQAAYRRDRAMRDAYLAKSQLWRASRQVCDEQALSYDLFGFGSVGLAYPDPREEGIHRGFNLPEGAAPSQSGPIYADTVQNRLRQRLQAPTTQASEPPATILPHLYTSAIHAQEKRFGPEVANAIKRHERRGEKLERRRAQEGRRLSSVDEEDFSKLAMIPSAAFGPSASQVGEGTTSTPLGLRENTGRPPTAVATTSHAPRYITDPNDVSYQPPLGTHPEVMREDDLQRRQQQLLPHPVESRASSTIRSDSPGKQ